MTEDEEREERKLRVDFMQTQIELYKAQFRWEPVKALAAMLAPAAPQPTQFVLQPGTTIQVLPAPGRP